MTVTPRAGGTAANGHRAPHAVRHHHQQHNSHNYLRPPYSLHRVAALVVLFCAAGSFFLLWRPSLLRTPSGLATSASGHRYHPKLCSSSDSISSDSSTLAAGCSELHDPQLAQELVQLPPGGLQLLSGSRGDAQLLDLQQLLQTAVQQQWPLPLARRVVSLLLQGAVPHVAQSSGGTTSQHQTASGLSAEESGHAAGWRFATRAVSLLQSRSDNQLVPCSFDPSLPTDFHTRFLYTATWPASASPSSSDIYIYDDASGSGNSGSSVLANAVLQLLSAAALLPPGYAYISVFVPTGTTADSLVWLDLLQLLATPLGVPLNVVQGGGQGSSAPAAGAPSQAVPPTPPAAAAADATAAGGAGASQALNAALAPFFPAWRQSQQQQQPTPAAAAAGSEQPTQLGGDAPPPPTTSSSTPTTTSSSSISGRISHGSCPPGRPTPECYSPEFVVLLQPRLYFCAGDLVRLQEYPEDLVCGLQLDEHKPAQVRRHQRLHHRRLHQQQQQQQQKHQQGGGNAAGSRALQQQQQHQGGVSTSTSTTPSTTEPVHEGPMASAVAAAGQAVLKPEVAPEFELHSLRAAYDAAREVTGEMLSAHAPYISHTPSLDLARAGLPVPMYCCGGGVAKLSAAPLAAGLRFRAGEEGECHPPDPMSLLCDDLWRTGHTHILLDPGVRTSSQLRTKSLFENPHFPFFYYSQNWETTAWFDIHPLLPLQYWNSTAHPPPPSAGKVVASNTTSSSSSSDASGAGGGGVSGDDGGVVVGVADDGTLSGGLMSAPATWTTADWQPGDQQMCCEGQQWLGDGERYNQPSDCRRVSALSGKNHTQAFLARCGEGAGGGVEQGC